MTEKEILGQFKKVLEQTTGYYYPDDRAQYLLDRITQEAIILTHWLDAMSHDEVQKIDRHNSMRYKQRSND